MCVVSKGVVGESKCMCVVGKGVVGESRCMCVVGKGVVGESVCVCGVCEKVQSRCVWGLKGWCVCKGAEQVCMGFKGVVCVQECRAGVHGV